MSCLTIRKQFIMTSFKEVLKTKQKMKNLKLPVIIAITALGLAACSKNGPCINGSGGYASRSYSVSAFNEISSYGDAQVIVSKDTITSIRVEAQQNVLDALNLEVRNGELQIGRNNCFRNTKTIKVYVSTPSLSSVNLSGSGSIEGIGTFSAHSFRSEISGSGSISFAVDVDNLNCTSSGSGTLHFAGSADYQDIEMSGSGQTHNFDLQSREANVRISGSGSCEVRVSDKLDVHISGSGNVFYKGNPIINSSISGSGRLISKS